MEASPTSTAGHHVSAVTLAEGVFTRPMGAGRHGHEQHEGDMSGSEWDPDRSLGRLVGELGKVMQSVRLSSPMHAWTIHETDCISIDRIPPPYFTLLASSITPFPFTLHFVPTQPKPVIHA